VNTPAPGGAAWLPLADAASLDCMPGLGNCMRQNATAASVPL